MTPPRRQTLSKKLHRDIANVSQRLQNGAACARVPLFIFGAGVSAGRVPTLRQIGRWLLDQLNTLPPSSGSSWLKEHCTALANNQATRRQAAELFSTLQRPIDSPRSNGTLDDLWRTFSEGLLTKGLTINGDSFDGICTGLVRPSPCHEFVAREVCAKRAFVLSLNFDALTYAALRDQGDGHALSLHTLDEILHFFTASTPSGLPPVFKVRGDVFYARCNTKVCPGFHAELPIDRLRRTSTAESRPVLLCPQCGFNSLSLQFSFPGYRAKEEAAYPMLWTLRQFIAPRVSALVLLGFSGRWDRYLLDFLFDFAQERDLLLVHVDPCSQSDNLVATFQSTYYPKLSRPLGTHNFSPSSFQHLKTEADPFSAALSSAVGD